jgi:hypothetical protein
MPGRPQGRDPLVPSFIFLCQVANKRYFLVGADLVVRPI